MKEHIAKLYCNTSLDNKIVNKITKDINKLFENSVFNEVLDNNVGYLFKGDNFLYLNTDNENSIHVYMDVNAFDNQPILKVDKKYFYKDNSYNIELTTDQLLDYVYYLLISNYMYWRVQGSFWGNLSFEFDY